MMLDAKDGLSSLNANLVIYFVCIRSLPDMPDTK